VSALRLHAGRRGLLIAASPLGKAKMALQVAMVVVLMAFGMDPFWVQALVYATVGFTIASGFDYFAAYRRRELVPATPPVTARPGQQIVR
jgi:phosphatidylglycerophosphate synthase